MTRSIRFTPAAWEDCRYWQGQDKKTSKTLGRINLLIEAARREPFAGIGKPEPLLGNLAGSTGQGGLMARIAWFTPLTMPILT